MAQITRAINESVGETPASSVRSYLNLNTSTYFVRSERGVYQVRTELFEDSSSRFFEQAGRKLQATFQYGRAVLVHSDCFDWMRARPEKSMNAIVTEPPDASDDQGRVSVEVAILRKCRRVLGVDVSMSESRPAMIAGRSISSRRCSPFRDYAVFPLEWRSHMSQGDN